VSDTLHDQQHGAEAAVSPPKAASKRWRPAPNRVALTVVVLGAALTWEVTARVGIVDALFVSYPTAILGQIPELAREERVRDAIVTTGLAMIWAAFYGTVAGIALGYMMGFFRAFRGAFYGPALFLMSVPKSIFIPVFMVFFGINVQTAVYYGAFSSFVYVLINVVSGFDLIQERHLRVAQAYGASLRHRIIDVVLPASLPGVFTGIWYGIKQGLQGVLIFELFVSVGGLGQTITFYTNGLRADRVFALILFVSVVAIVAGQGWTALEKRLSRWRPESA
jgi:ABC-type nitrate/sulfonate/bicarbonate transport system permease component